MNECRYCLDIMGNIDGRYESVIQDERKSEIFSFREKLIFLAKVFVMILLRLKYLFGQKQLL